MRKIEPWVADILGRSTIDGCVLKLPGQLARDLYQKVDKVLKGLGGKWNRKLGGHEFSFDPRELISSSAENGTYTDRKQDLQLFETPVELAERMARLSWCGPGSIVLEPSAGTGRLVRPLIARRAKVVAVEPDAINVDALKALDDGFAIYRETFEDFSKRGTSQFDAVVMNPPFSKGQDIAHIRLGWNMLKPGGRLIAICGEGAFFQAIRRATEFLRWLSDYDIETERLPAGTFHDSGTDVSSRLLCGTKHKEADARERAAVIGQGSLF